MEQRWFVGAHANVDGGYKHDLLPAPPRKWLADRAALCGLEFVNDRGLPSEPGVSQTYCQRAPAAFDLDGSEYLSPIRDSYTEFGFGLYRLVRSLPFMGSRVYRRMLVDDDGIGQTVDPTAYAKWQVDSEYRPPNLGQAGRVDVAYNRASEAWTTVVDEAAATGTAYPDLRARYLPPKDQEE